MEYSTNYMKYLFLWRTCIIGFFGGVFVVLFLGLIHYFNLIELNIFTPWKSLFKHFNLSTKWYIYPIWIIFYGFISIWIALIYYFVGKFRNHWDLGALFGVIIGVTTYIVLPIVLYDQHFLQDYLLKTHISYFVSFILYGVFIGYSISYEYALIKANTQQ